MKFGVIIGKFLPLHNGSLTLCKVAQTLSENLVIIVRNNQNDPISFGVRVSWLKNEFPKAIIKGVSDKNFLPEEPEIKFILSEVAAKLVSCNFHLYSSDAFTAELAEILCLKFTILDPDRLAQNISSKQLITSPYSNWFDMPFSVRRSLVRRIVLIGPESVGKSTLANRIKTSFAPHPFLPEYGRPYELFRTKGPYSDEEFDTIANVHSAHRKSLLPTSGPIFVEDTDELATAVWAEMLMQKQLPNIEKKIKLPYLYLLMDPSVPFASEKIRYFDKEKRVLFFEKIKTKLNHYHAHYQILTGSWADREIEAKNIIQKLLSEKLNWSKIG